ncbi:recombination factor protein RarA [Pseudomonas aeruginosa]|nr:recombination factor protein RarA [Pseudomonas aeruginosa]
MPLERIISRGSGAAALLSTGAEGLELKIRDKLEHLAELDRTSPRQRRKS